MKLEFLLQFIVPLTFLAIWALTSLLNRDAQPLPPRPGAGRGPGVGPARVGAGGGFSPATRGELTRSASPARPASPMPDRSAPARWSSATVPGRPVVRPDAGRRRGDRDHRIRVAAAQGSSSFSPSAAASGPRATRATSPAARRGPRAPARRPLPPRRSSRNGGGPDRPGRPVPGSEAFQAAGDRPALDADDADPSGPLTSASLTPAPEVNRRRRRTIRASPSTTSAPC